ncbi:hypothetical protein KAR91_39055 [Candidatus Pacearchaeota archaeon]|nr:hypothetical protein [Candidatus Pacearchaeota archaeon]
MKSLEIYYWDLSDEVKRQFDTIFGPPEDFNHDTVPLFIYEVEDEEQDPCEHDEVDIANKYAAGLDKQLQSMCKHTFDANDDEY